MTVSPDARTPSADLHTLTRSTPPGARPLAQPFGIAAAPVAELPDPFVSLGAAPAGVASGHAARRAHPDAAVIDLAGRVQRLAERNYVGRARMERLQEQISAAHPSPFQRTGRAATQEEFKAHQDEVRPIEERLGLTRLRRRGGRMMNRLVRWTQQLTVMKPQTLAGLGAKAAAVLAVRECDRFDFFTDDLADAATCDAVRLAGTARDREADGELMALIAKHGPAVAATKTTGPVPDDVTDAAGDLVVEIECAILDAVPHTFAGLQAKARWIEAQPSAEDWHTSILNDVLAMAAETSVSATSASQSQSNLRPVPIDRIRSPIDRYPVGIPREVVESYRTWLWEELRFLEHEVYGTVDDPIPYWMDNPAGSFHGSRQAPPSTRAAAVLGFLGLMPTETLDGTPLPTASAA